MVAVLVECLDGGTGVCQLALETRGRAAPLQLPVGASTARRTTTHTAAGRRQLDGLVDLVDERRQALALHRVVVDVEVCMRRIQSHHIINVSRQD